MSHFENTRLDEMKAEMAQEPAHLLRWALDADFTNAEIKAGLIPTRSLFTDVKELAYLSEVDSVIEAALMRVGTSIRPNL